MGRAVVVASVSVLALLLGGCAGSAASGTAPASGSAELTRSTTAAPCDPIREAKSWIWEPAPWEGPEQMVRGADAVLVGEVVAVGPASAERGRTVTSDGVTEPPLTVYEAHIEVTDVLTTDDDVSAGDVVTVANGAVRGDAAGEPCLLLSTGDTVVVGLVRSTAAERFVLFNVDSVLYIDGDDVRDTGRGYGGIGELEALTPDALLDRLAGSESARRPVRGAW